MNLNAAKARVLHVTTGLELGGAERILYNCAISGITRGFEPRVVALKSGGHNRALLEEKGIDVHELAASASIPDPIAIGKLITYISDFKPDIIMGWMYHGNLFASLATALSRHVSREKLIWGIYNSNLDLAKYSWRMSAVIKAGARFSAHPAAIVYNSKNALIDHRELGYHARNDVLINNGVDTQLFKPDPALREAARKLLGVKPSANLAMIVARVDPQKDWQTVLSGVAKVENLTTVAVGPTTIGLKPQDNLILHGAHMKMQDLYPAADVFILPSAFGEGTSVAMTEAMSCGVPVIVTDVGDNAKYAKNCGYVIERGNPDALAAALRSALQDKSTLAKLSLNARQTALDNFGPESSFIHLFELWESMVPKRPTL